MVSTMKNAESMGIPEGYKQTEVGVIPTDWEVTKIGRICNVAVGKDVDLSYSKESDCKYCYPVFSNTVDVPGIYGYYDYPEYSGDVVTVVGRGVGLGTAICRSGGFGAIGRLIVLFPQKGVNQNFLASYINHKIDVFSESSGVPQLTGIAFANYDIALPPSEEQTAIANALTDVDNLIASLETLIAKKSAIKTAAMQQLLTGKKRLPAFVKESEKQGAKQSSELDNTSETAQAAETKQTSTLNSDLYKESGEGLDEKSNQHSDVSNANNKQTAPRPGYKQTELGEIPEDWEVKTLGDLGKFKNGVNKDGDSFGFGQPFVNLMDVFGKTAIKGDEKLGLINSTELDRKEYDLRTGDVLFIRSSVKPSGVGLTAVVLSDLENTIYSGFLIRYRSLAALDLQFKQFCFHEAGFRKRIVAASSVSANTNINQDSLKQLLLAYPSDTKEQAAIASVLSDMDTELDALKQRLSKTQKIKQGMMQELLTGKTRLLVPTESQKETKNEH
jgi:restriction endonuclease S subunit